MQLHFQFPYHIMVWYLNNYELLDQREKEMRKFTFLGKIWGLDKMIQTVMTTVIWISIFSLRMFDDSGYMVRLFNIQSTSLPEGNCRSMHSRWCLPVVVVMDVCVCVSQSFQILNQLTDFHKSMHECEDTWGYLHITLFNFVHRNVAKYMILWDGSGT